MSSACMRFLANSFGAPLSFREHVRLKAGATGTHSWRSRGFHSRDGSIGVLIAAMMESCANQVAVHLSDELEWNFLGANRFTLAVIRATAEEFIGHGRYHAERAAIALRWTLRK